MEHQHNITQQVKCPAENCQDNYIGESAKCVIENVKAHGGRDTKSRVLKHNIENEYVETTQKDFGIIARHFNNNRHKRKIAEALIIKQEHLTSLLSLTSPD